MFSIVLLDSRERICFVTHVPNPLTYRDLLGKSPWDESLVSNPEQLQAALMRAISSGEPQAVDARTQAIGIWRTFMYPVPNIPAISAVLVSRPVPDDVAAMSKREREVAGLIAAGKSAKQIAAKLRIKRSTVDNHRAAIARRLRCQTAELNLRLGFLAHLFL